MNKKISIFTANLEDNKNLESSLHQLCIDSWKTNLVKLFKNKGIYAEVKIFNYESKEVQEFLKLMKEFDFIGPAVKTEAFRIWMLSQYENYLWLDWDVYIPNEHKAEFDFDVNSEFFSKKSFILYNARNLDFFKKLFQNYIQYSFWRNNSIETIFKKFNFKENLFLTDNWQSYFIHLSSIDENKLSPIKWIDGNSLIKDNLTFKKLKKRFSLVSKDTLPFPSSEVINCYGDEKLINYIKSIEKESQKIIKEINFDITNKCNRSCISCNHLSPIAMSKKDIDMQYAESVFKRLSSLKIRTLVLAGGEPLLNSYFTEICKRARQYLPSTKIKVITNGSFLNKYYDRAEILNDLKINFYVSNYNQFTDKQREEIKNKFKYIKLEKSTDNSQKEFQKINFDLTGKSDSLNSFCNCICNKPYIWDDENLYTCPPMGHMLDFISFFNLNTDIMNKINKINIFTADDDQIYSFCNTPYENCRFCDNTKNVTFKSNSKGKHLINEWCS